MYIVLICKPKNYGTGVQHPCAFSGEDRDLLIQRAIAYRGGMQNSPRSGTRGTYNIYVGEITHEVEQPVSYRLVEL